MLAPETFCLQKKAWPRGKKEGWHHTGTHLVKALCVAQHLLHNFPALVLLRGSDAELLHLQVHNGMQKWSNTYWHELEMEIMAGSWCGTAHNNYGSNQEFYDAYRTMIATFVCTY